MAPDVLCRTPHEAGMLDRTGIISSSAPRVLVAPDVPPDAYRPRARRSQFAALAAIVLMAAVVVTGVRERPGSTTEVTRTTAGGSQAVEDVPVASSPRSSPLVLEGEPDTAERTTPPAPEDTSSRTSPAPSSSVKPTPREVVPSVVSSDPGRRHDPADGLRDERGELPVSVDIPAEEAKGPGSDKPPRSAVFPPSSPADEALRARSDNQRGGDPPSARPTRTGHRPE